MDFNKVIITGYVANEYKVKNFEKNNQEKKVLNGIILVNGSNDKTTPIKITAWDKVAEVLENNTVKGSKVMLEGEWAVNTYEKDGKTIYDNYMLVTSFTFIESKDELDRKRAKIDHENDPFGNIAAGKESIYDNNFGE
ncbi:single-stranded DNA-binding protein [Staphylococcus sp. Marseille-Q6910]|uniref:single-stranded DNA-binding protein n=1 Tax=Staphylococcus sp. Marseille-Q6910 TaxID=2937990 RepID=UPI00203D34C8|nr:single-stranded DNA-binding protein [Staphylococcus sp. Marseille-Q6910]